MADKPAASIDLHAALHPPAGISMDVWSRALATVADMSMANPAAAIQLATTLAVAEQHNPARRWDGSAIDFGNSPDDKKGAQPKDSLDAFTREIADDFIREYMTGTHISTAQLNTTIRNTYTAARKAFRNMPAEKVAQLADFSVATSATMSKVEGNGKNFDARATKGIDFLKDDKLRNGVFTALDKAQELRKAGRASEADAVMGDVGGAMIALHCHDAQGAAKFHQSIESNPDYQKYQKMHHGHGSQDENERMRRHNEWLGHEVGNAYDGVRAYNHLHPSVPEQGNFQGHRADFSAIKNGPEPDTATDSPKPASDKAPKIDAVHNTPKAAAKPAYSPAGV